MQFSDNTNKEKPIVYIFYTGGWDSTFRLLQLAENDIIIQPIYVVDDQRVSQTYEQKAMDSIIYDIRNSILFHANINEILKYDRKWIIDNCKCQEISNAYQNLKKKHSAIGSQYEWLALLSHHLQHKIEIGLEGNALTPPRLWPIIFEECNLVPIKNDILPGRYYTTPKDGKTDGQLIFGNLIMGMKDISKIAAKEISEEKGWIEIMKKTWFCFTPIHGKPCGVCHPCKGAIEEGMGWRLPESAKKRYFHSQKWQYKILHKMKSSLYCLVHHL